MNAYLLGVQWVISILSVSFGQSSHSILFSIVAASLGYACFWRVATFFYSRKVERFWISVLWFGLSQAFHLSWFSSSEYMGPLIWVVYAGLVFVLSLQFGCLSLFFPPALSQMRPIHCFALAGCWVLLEWTRLFFFTGFTWNPVGLSLADSAYAIGFASVVGVYGLSFWVIFVNALALYALEARSRAFVWAACMVFPYLFGFCQMQWVERFVPVERMWKVALVQTAIFPDQKDFFLEKRERFIPYLDQWARIWEKLPLDRDVDLLVFPEAAVGAGAFNFIYPVDLVEEVLGVPSSTFKERKVSNGSIMQSLAMRLQSDVIGGFDDVRGGKAYNAAFHFSANGGEARRYAKRILTPVGEYIPFGNISWVSQFLLKQFGIASSFDVGDQVGIYMAQGEFPLGVSICLEETYSGLMRELRESGARLFVNISNDAWFPFSRLPYQHFAHGRLRSAENGVYSLRACNTGVTGAIDCFGNGVATLPLSHEKVDVLLAEIPIRSFHTLYTLWGDLFILSCSVLFLLLYFGLIFVLPARDRGVD